MYNTFGVFPPFFPYPPVSRRRERVKQLGIFELPTTGVNVTADTVDFGINPCIYNQLPCECYITFKVRQTVPAAGAGLPATVVVPNSSKSTVPNSGVAGSAGSSTATPGTQKVPIVDHKNDNVVGSDIVSPTERFGYLNKATGVLRFVEFATAGGGAAPTAASVRKV